MRRFDRLQKCLKMVFLGSGSAKHIYSTMGCDIKLWCNICQRAEGRSAVAVGTCPAALMQRNIWGKRRKIHGPWRVIGRDFSSCLERRRNWVLILTQYCLMCSPVISKFFMWKCCFFYFISWNTWWRVVSAVAILCGVCTISQWEHGFSLGCLVSSHSLDIQLLPDDQVLILFLGGSVTPSCHHWDTKHTR